MHRKTSIRWAAVHHAVTEAEAEVVHCLAQYCGGSPLGVEVGIAAAPMLSRNMKRAILLIFVLLHLTYTARLHTGFFPTGEELVHQYMETGIVAWFQKMAQFMNHHVLDTPFRQQQQIGGETDGLVLDIADTPT